MKALATPLPTTFRINNSCPFAEKCVDSGAIKALELRCLTF